MTALLVSIVDHRQKLLWPVERKMYLPRMEYYANIYCGFSDDFNFDSEQYNFPLGLR